MKDTILKTLTFITLGLAVFGIIYENATAPDGEIMYIDEFDTVYAADVYDNHADNMEVTHVYEDGCMDVLNTKTDEYIFACESAFE